MKHPIIPILCTAAALLLPAAETDAQAEPLRSGTDSTADTLISVGSVSKMFVTTAVMQLADQGKIDIDAPVTAYLPEFRLADSRYRDITVRMLMNHRSGLMGSRYSGDILLNDRSTVIHDTMLDFLSNKRLKADPGAYGAYCNDGFEILELIAERVSGQDFTSYLNTQICKPLGLRQTGTPTDAFQTTEQVRTYLNKTEYAPDYCMSYGGGGVLSTAPELCTFGTAFFTGENVLLSEKAKDAMRTCSADDPYEDGFGLGWDSVGETEYGAAGVQVVSKGGDLSLQHAELLVAPDQQISVAVLSSGGSSSSDAALARALMDIALEEQGIRIDRSVPEKPQTADTVPEHLLQYEGLYADSSMIWQLTFPEQKYAKFTCLTDPEAEDVLMLPTVQSTLVRVNGRPDKGHYAITDHRELFRFREKSGSIYLTCESYCGDAGTGFTHSTERYFMQKTEPCSVSAEAQKAWDARNGKRYYLFNASASDSAWSENCILRVILPEGVSGYVGSWQIKDKNRAEAVIHIPSSASRDLTDLEIRTENGSELLCMTDMGTVYLSEDAIKDLPADCTEVQLTTGAASWYNTGSGNSRSVTLDIPPRAAVYVCDKRGRLTYSSYMKEGGRTVPLPPDGKIVFVGETGTAVGVKQE